MPIEIRELVLKATVNNDPGMQQSKNDPGMSYSKKERAAIVSECIEQMMEIFKNKSER